MKNYYLEENDDFFHDWARDGVTVYRLDDNEPVGTVSLYRDNVFTNGCVIDMELGEAADELSEMDKTAIYWKCVQELNDYYDD